MPKSLTGHIDIVPTVLSLCGVSADQAGQFAGRSLPGRISRPPLRRPGARGAARCADSVLFTTVGWRRTTAELRPPDLRGPCCGHGSRRPCASRYRPNLKKRGSLRLRFDSRYKFTRYFSPIDRNRPRDLDEYRWNDMEVVQTCSRTRLKRRTSLAKGRKTLRSSPR